MNKLLIWISLLGKGKSKNRGEGNLGFTCIHCYIYLFILMYTLLYLKWITNQEKILS